MQNSSRLDEKIAVKRSRSSSGMRSSPTSASTRASHSSHESSRSKSRDGAVPFLLRRTATSTSGDQRERARPQKPAQLAAFARDRLDGGRSRLGKRDARARDGVHERREVGLVADQHEVVAVAPVEAREVADLDAEQRRVAGQRSPEFLGDDLGGLVGARVRARDDALGIDPERGERAPGGARGAATRGHEATLGIGRAERAILGLSVSDEDQRHGPSIVPAARRENSRHALGHRFFTARSRSAAGGRGARRAIAILPR